MAKLVQKRSEFRLYVGDDLIPTMNQWMGNTRYTWNLCVRLNRQNYSNTKKFMFKYDIDKLLPLWKRESDKVWLGLNPAISLKQVVRDYDQTLRMALKDKKDPKLLKKDKRGFPKIKKKRHGNGSCYLSGQIIKLTQSENNKKNGWLKLPKVTKLIKIKGGIFPGPNDHLQSVRIIQRNFKYYLSICYMGEVTKKLKDPVREVMGVDVGLRKIVMDSTGDSKPAPKFFRKLEDKLAQVQSKFDKLNAQARKLAKQQGVKFQHSKNQIKRLNKLANIHTKIVNQRKDFLHKLSLELITKTQVIGMEKLKVKNMIKSHNLAKSIADVSWSKLTQMIRYKSDWYGRRLIQLGTFDRSTGCCPVCNEIGSKLGRNEYSWVHAKCGTIHDRDLAAAQWIELKVKEQWIELKVKEQLDRELRELIGQGMPEFTHGEKEPLLIGSNPDGQVFSLNHEYITEVT